MGIVKNRTTFLESLYVNRFCMDTDREKNPAFHDESTRFIVKRVDL